MMAMAGARKVKVKAKVKAKRKAVRKPKAILAKSIARRGLMLVLSSPSGAGKTTLSRMLLEADSKVELSVSVTTRARRANEKHGRDYRFIQKPQFDEMVEQGELLEEATTVLFDRAIPDIARSLQNPDGFMANVRDLRAIAADDLTVDAIVDREGGQGEAFVKVRNRVYQRHKRTRGYLLEVPRNKPADLARLSAWLVDAGVRPELEREVRRVAAEVFAPRVDRGDGRSDTQEHNA